MKAVLRPRWARAAVVSRRRRHVLLASAGVVGALVTSGCQSYRAQPLDLAGHQSAVAARPLQTELLSEFVARLQQSGHDTPVAFDPADGISLAEGQAFAIFYNPDLRLARLEAGVTLATMQNAGQWDDPELGFDGAQILSPGNLFEYGLMLNLTIPVSGRLAVERARAGAEHEAALRRIVDAEWTTRARVRSAWSAWSAAVERVTLLEQAIAQGQRVGEIAGRLEHVGEITRVEGRLLRIELIQRQSELVDAENKANRARVELLGLMGLSPDASVTLVPAIQVQPAAGDGTDADQIIQSSTLLAVRRAEYQAAEETLRLEIREQYPDLTIGGGYGNEDDDRLLLGASIPIPILNANRAAIAEAGARRELARAAAETTLEQLIRQAAIARRELAGAIDQRQAFEARIVPMLDEQSDDIQQLAALGEVDTLLLLETLSRGYEARSRLLDMRLSEAEASIELHRILGPATALEPSPVDVSNTGQQRVPDGTPDDASAASGGGR